MSNIRVNDKRVYEIEDLEVLLDNIPYQAWMKNEDGKYIYANKMMLETFNLKEDEVLGKSDEEFMDQNLAKGCIYTDQEALTSNTSVVHEERSIKNNEEIWYEVIKFPIKKDDKQYIAGYAKEITFNKIFEFETEKMLSSMLDLYKQEDYIIFIQKMLKKMQGILNCKSINLFLYEKEDDLFKLFLDSNDQFSLFEKNTKVNVPQNVIKTLQANSLDSESKNKLYLNFKNEYKQDIDLKEESKCKIYPIKLVDEIIGGLYIYYEDGSSLKYVNEFFVRDVCERIGNMLINMDSRGDLQKNILRDYILKSDKEKIEEVIEIEHLKTNFLANISHEFRTPINIMLSSIRMLMNNLSKDSVEIDKRNIKYINMLKQNAYRLLRLVNNVVDTTKICNGFFQIDTSNHNIISIIEEIVLSTVEYIGENKRNIIFDTNEEELIIACDPDKIERIMLNLISNSLKFSGEYGNIYVEIDVKHEEERVYLHIRNDGSKISEEESKIIFDRFVQTDRLLSRKNEGSGIGLFIVKSLIEMHGGEIWVNTEVEKGAEFIFYLPIKKAEDEKIRYDLESDYDEKVERCKIEFSDVYSV